MKKQSDLIWLLEYVFGAAPSFFFLIAALFFVIMGYIHWVTIIGVMSTSAILFMVSPARENIITGDIVIKSIFILSLLSGCILSLSFLFGKISAFGINGFTLMFTGPLLVGVWYIYLIFSCKTASNK